MIIPHVLSFRLMDQTPATSSLKLQQITANSSPFEYVKAGAAVGRNMILEQNVS